MAEEPPPLSMSCGRGLRDFVSKKFYGPKKSYVVNSENNDGAVSEENCNNNLENGLNKNTSNDCRKEEINKYECKTMINDPFSQICKVSSGNVSNGNQLSAELDRVHYNNNNNNCLSIGNGIQGEPSSAHSTAPSSNADNLVVVDNIQLNANSSQMLHSPGRNANANGNVLQGVNVSSHYENASSQPSLSSPLLPEMESESIDSSEEATVPSPEAATVSSPEAATLPKPGVAIVPPPGAATLPKPGAAVVPPPEEATVPSSEEATVPSSEAATVPSSEAATVPSSEAATVPSSEEPTVPSSEAATVPSSEAATVPSSEAAMVPSSEAATVPSSEAATVPSSEAATVPSSEAAMVPSSEAATVPSSEAATVPSSEAATVPSSEAATVPSSEEATVPSSEAATVPSSEEPTVPSSEAATVPSSEAAMVPSSEEATVPSSEAAAVPSSEAATVPSSEAITVPSSEAATVPSPEAETVPSLEAATLPKLRVAIFPPPGATTVSTPEAAAIPPHEEATVPLPEVETVPPPGVATISKPGAVTVPPPGVATVPKPRAATVPPSGTATISKPGATIVLSPGATIVLSPGVANVPPPEAANVLSPVAANVQSPGAANVQSPGAATGPPSGPTTVLKPGATSVSLVSPVHKEQLSSQPAIPISEDKYSPANSLSQLSLWQTSLCRRRISIGSPLSILIFFHLISSSYGSNQSHPSTTICQALLELFIYILEVLGDPVVLEILVAIVVILLGVLIFTWVWKQGGRHSNRTLPPQERLGTTVEAELESEPRSTSRDQLSFSSTNGAVIHPVPCSGKRSKSKTTAGDEEREAPLKEDSKHEKQSHNAQNFAGGFSKQGSSDSSVKPCSEFVAYENVEETGSVFPVTTTTTPGATYQDNSNIPQSSTVNNHVEESSWTHPDAAYVDGSAIDNITDLQDGGGEVQHEQNSDSIPIVSQSSEYQSYLSAMAGLHSLPVITSPSLVDQDIAPPNAAADVQNFAGAVCSNDVTVQSQGNLGARVAIVEQEPEMAPIVLADPMDTYVPLPVPGGSIEVPGDEVLMLSVTDAYLRPFTSEMGPGMDFNSFEDRIEFDED